MPLWSPDEDRLAFSNRLKYTKMHEGYPLRTVQEDIYVADANGTRPVPITHQEYFHIHPLVWSPDGTVILARASNLFPNPQPYDPTYTEHVVMVRADGSGLKEITPFPEAHSLPTSWRR